MLAGLRRAKTAALQQRSDDFSGDTGWEIHLKL
jgi:hypothetical protein